MELRRFAVFIFIFLIGVFVERAQALTWEARNELSLYPGFSRSGSLTDNNTKDQSDLFLIGNSRVNATGEAFTFEIEPELRDLHANSALSDAARSSVVSPSRLLNLTWNAGQTERSETVMALEKANLGYRLGSAEFSLGRKPVSLGVLSVFPVWNKFSRPLITDFGPLRVSGQDQVSVRVQHEAWAARAFDIEEAHAEGATRVGEGSWYGENLELHALAGSLWTEPVWGLAGVKDVAGTSLRAEGLSIRDHGWQVGLGAERALSAVWSVLAEWLYLEEGAARKEDYFTLAPSRFRFLNARDYLFARAEWKPAPLWTLQLGGLFNLIDSSVLENAKAIYAWSDNIEASFELRVPRGADDAELSNRTLPIQAIAGGRWVF